MLNQPLELFHSGNNQRKVQRFCKTLVQRSQNALFSVEKIQEQTHFIKCTLLIGIELKMSGECYYSNSHYRRQTNKTYTILLLGQHVEKELK